MPVSELKLLIPAMCNIELVRERKVLKALGANRALERTTELHEYV
jgi:predicted lysophospholipase L1 biosynthesis ABC-type transport system permease subunit